METGQQAVPMETGQQAVPGALRQQSKRRVHLILVRDDRGKILFLDMLRFNPDVQMNEN
jgi:hypothetical protein